MALNNSLANPRLLCILAAIEARANDVEQLAGEPEQVASDRRKNATEAEKGKEGESEPPVLLGVAYTLASPSDPLDLGEPIITALERNCEAFTVAQDLCGFSRLRWRSKSCRAWLPWVSEALFCVWSPFLGSADGGARRSFVFESR